MELNIAKIYLIYLDNARVLNRKSVCVRLSVARAAAAASAARWHRLRAAGAPGPGRAGARGRRRATDTPQVGRPGPPAPTPPAQRRTRQFTSSLSSSESAHHDGVRHHIRHRLFPVKTLFVPYSAKSNKAFIWKLTIFLCASYFQQVLSDLFCFVTLNYSDIILFV